MGATSSAPRSRRNKAARMSPRITGLTHHRLTSALLLRTADCTEKAFEEALASMFFICMREHESRQGARGGPLDIAIPPGIPFRQHLAGPECLRPLVEAPRQCDAGPVAM